VLTQILAKGDGVILGSLDGMKTSPTMHLVRVPATYRSLAAEDRKGWPLAERERAVEPART